jgi:hypothetical protein
VLDNVEKRFKISDDDDDDDKIYISNKFLLNVAVTGAAITSSLKRRLQNIVSNVTFSSAPVTTRPAPK